MGLILDYLSLLHPYIGYALMGLGTLTIVGQSYVMITPNQKDDAWFSKLESVPVMGAFIRAVKSFAPIQRK